MSEGHDVMHSLVESLPDQFEQSATLPGLESIQPESAPGGRILFCGMGGSAIGAQLGATLLQGEVPSLEVWRNYGLPHWVGPGDLVIVGSYSGGTEESLSALAEARKRGTRRILISSGGQLAAGRLDDEPLVVLPGGLPPRAALGYSMGALLQILGRLGYLPDLGADLEEAVALMRDGGGPEGGGPGELASLLKGRIPVLYAADALTAAVAVRWKGQLNENAKVPALVAEFPELNHNDIVGWGLGSAWQDRFVLVILRSGLENERLDRRITLTADLLSEEFAHTSELRAAGQSPLARLLNLVHHGDRLSCSLARLRGVDPVPVTRIDRLKDGLK